jgi:hypothetical protein
MAREKKIRSFVSFVEEWIPEWNLAEQLKKAARRKKLEKIISKEVKKSEQ